MTFLNIALLLGALAAAIPIIIHFFHRSRFKVVTWGAMHLLQSVILTNTRRMRIEQLILLLIRAAIPVALALLMANPILTKFKALLSNAQTSMVIVLDDSYSMEVGGPLKSNYELARETTEQILGELRKGSDAVIIRTTDPKASLPLTPTFDLEGLRGKVRETRTRYLPALLPETLEQSVDAFKQLTHANREMVVISDFQAASWDERRGPARRSALELVRSQKIPPRVTYIDLDRQTDRNVAVESISMSRKVVGQGEKINVRANVKNYGLVPEQDLRIYFRVNGLEQDVTQVSLAPGQKSQALFTYAFKESGSHYLEVFVDADPLEADNSCFFSLPVLESIPVLLLNGAPSQEPLKGETDFLQVALQPFRAAEADLPDLIEVREVESKRFHERDLHEVRVVVMANIDLLRHDQLHALQRFVERGGGLLAFPGDRADADWHNRELVRRGRGILPATLEALSGDIEDDQGFATVVAEHYDSAALDFFNDPRNGSLSDARIRLWYQLAVQQPFGPHKQQEAIVLARLDNGDPLLVEKEYGEGRVIQCATACDADWSNLPIRPFYVPLMQQLVAYLASTVYPPRNVTVGQPLMVFLPLQRDLKALPLTDPEGQEYDVPVVARDSYCVAEFPETIMPGLYAYEDPNGYPIHFVVNSSRRESELEQLSKEEVAAQAEAAGAQVVHSWKEYANLDTERRFGREMWTWFLGVLLALVFAEITLEHLFTRRKTG